MLHCNTLGYIFIVYVNSMHRSSKFTSSNNTIRTNNHYANSESNFVRYAICDQVRNINPSTRSNYAGALGHIRTASNRSGWAQNYMRPINSRRRKALPLPSQDAKKNISEGRDPQASPISTALRLECTLPKRESAIFVEKSTVKEQYPIKNTLRSGTKRVPLNMGSRSSRRHLRHPSLWEPQSSD